MKPPFISINSNYGGNQYVFYQQFEVLKKYANQREVQLIGDLPFYVGADSSDVWANRSLFSVDEDGNIVEFAGIPNKNKPDTNWGNPCYVWSQHKKDGFAWWRQRIRFFSKYYDALRIDHAVGTFHYYAISAEGQTGVWKEGPDTEGSFTQMIKNEAVANPSGKEKEREGHSAKAKGYALTRRSAELQPHRRSPVLPPFRLP